MPLRFRIELPPSRERRGRIERSVEVVAVDGIIRIGRRAGVMIELPLSNGSSLHARVVEENGGWILEDQRSTNGSFIGSDRVAPGGRRALIPGKRFRLADIELVFEGPPPAP